MLSYLKESFKNKKTLILLFIIIMIISKIFITIKNIPPLDVDNLKENLSENSKITDSNGQVLAEIVEDSFRSYVSIDDLPDYVPKAFVAIEDKRFFTHIGIDPIGIMSAVVDNIKARSAIRGASTITQQLIKNTHLSNEKTIDRKIKEAYLSIKLEQMLSKKEILEAYLNTNFFGQNAYGIEAASNTYFNKSAKNLTIDEAATLAAIIQNPNLYSPYKKIEKKDIDLDNDTILGDIVIGDKEYSCVFSPDFISRRDIIIKEMYKQGIINKKEYEKAITVDAISKIDPSNRIKDKNLLFLTDIVKNETIKHLKNIYNISYEEAKYLVENKGYTIKTFIEPQKQAILDRNYDTIAANEYLELQDLYIDNNSMHIKNSKDEILYYTKNQLLDENNWFYFDKDEYSIKDDGVYIKSNKIEFDNDTIYYKNYYTIDDNNSLKIHNISYTKFNDNELIVNNENQEITVTQHFLKENPDFFINDGKYLKINPNYYQIDREGIKQPEAHTLITNLQNNSIIAIYAGRNNYKGVNQNTILNHKISPDRLIRPFSLYYPYLEKDSNNTLTKKIFDKNEAYNNEIYGQLLNDKSLINDALEKFYISQDTSFVFKNENNNLGDDEGKKTFLHGKMIYGINILELTNSYSLLLSDESVKLNIVDQILDKEGNIIYNSNDRKKVKINNTTKKEVLKSISNYNSTNSINITELTNNKRNLINIYKNEESKHAVISIITNNKSKIDLYNKPKIFKTIQQNI